MNTQASDTHDHEPILPQSFWSTDLCQTIMEAAFLTTCSILAGSLVCQMYLNLMIVVAR